METTNKDIFFRVTEYNSLVESTINNANKIDVEAHKYFENTLSPDHLLSKASMIESVENIKFVYTSIYLKIDAIKNGQTSNHVPSKDYTILEYFNDYSYERYAGTNTKFFFWFTIIYISLILINKIYGSKRIPNVIYWFIVPLIGINLFNYYFKEPEILTAMSENIKYENYKSSAYIYNGLNTLSKFDIPIQDKNIYFEKNYSYNVSGNDAYSNYVEGEIVTNGENGDGFIIRNGNKIEIDVQWIGNGQLEGKDENGNLYNLEVD